jgi:hypothetical protein
LLLKLALDDPSKKKRKNTHRVTPLPTLPAAPRLRATHPRAMSGGRGSAGIPSLPRDTPVLPHHRKISDARVAMNGRNALEVVPDAPGFVPDSARFARVDAASVEAAARAAHAARQNGMYDRKRASGGTDLPPWQKEDAVTVQHAGACFGLKGRAGGRWANCGARARKP